MRFGRNPHLRHFFESIVPAYSQRSVEHQTFSWILRLRVVALIVHSALASPGIYFGFLRENLLLPYAIGVLILALFNSFSVFQLKTRAHIRQIDFFVQLFVDLMAITFLLFLSGGPSNPLWPILFLHAALAGAFLNFIWGTFFIFALFGSLVFLNGFRLPQLVVQTHSVPNWILISSYSCIALVIWIITLQLRIALREEQSRILALKMNQSRLDRLRAIGAVTANLAHEFATPLNTARIRLERFKRGSNDQEDIHVAMAGLSECEKALKAMVSDEINPELIKLQIVPIHSLVDKWVSEWKADQSNIDVHLEIDSEVKTLRAKIAALPLGQAFFNLLDNAVDAQAENQRVSIKLTREADQILCSIEDEGQGFEASILKNWGKSFVTTKRHGTGLGVYNAFQVFTALGGSLSASNRFEGGARVVWSLPIVAEGTAS